MYSKRKVLLEGAGLVWMLLLAATTLVLVKKEDRF